METATYESTPPLPPFKLEYPRDWRIVAGSGRGYADITFLGPQNKDDTLNLAFVIRFTKLSPKRANLNDLAEAYLSKRSKLRGYKLLSRSEYAIGQSDAAKVELSYSSPKNIDDFSEGFMTICERRVMFIYKAKLCELIYSASEDEFSRYDQDINAILRSLSFPE